VIPMIDIDRGQWVVRYDGYVDNELETTWESYDNLVEASERLIYLTDRWDNVAIEWHKEV